MIGYDVSKVSASQVSTLEIAKGFCAKVFTRNFLPNSHQIFSEKRRMSSLGTSKGVLEIAKFGLYVTIPIVLMYTFANNTKNLQKFMGNQKLGLYSMDGRFREAVRIFKEMVSACIQPVDSTFKSLGSVLMKCGVPKRAVNSLQLKRKNDAQSGLQAWMGTLSSVIGMDEDDDDDYA